MIKSMNMSIEISEPEYRVIKSFADFKGESVSEIVLGAVREQIELWEDFQDIIEYEEEKAQGLVSASSISEVRKRLGHE